MICTSQMGITNFSHAARRKEMQMHFLFISKTILQCLQLMLWKNIHRRIRLIA